MKNSLCISYQSEQKHQQALDFAQRLNLDCVTFDQIKTDLALNFTEERIELRDMHLNIAIHVDFISGSLAHRKQYGGGRGQAIAKAIGFKQGMQAPSVLDATAGLAKDSFVMACLGCSLTLVERSAIICQLVEHAIKQAKADPDFNAIIKHGFKLINSQASEYIKTLPVDNAPEVIYLDPMYPHRKKSAQVKKNMQILQKLLGHDEDTDELLKSALACAKKRVVVKRPKGAETIGSTKPTMQIESKKTRYDVYITSLNKKQ